MGSPDEGFAPTETRKKRARPRPILSEEKETLKEPGWAMGWIFCEFCDTCYYLLLLLLLLLLLPFLQQPILLLMLLLVLIPKQRVEITLKSAGLRRQPI